MSFDPFITMFGLSLEQQAKLNKYQSPRNEASLVKKVPLAELDELKELCKIVTGRKVRVMYRGPRYYGSYSTKRCYATHASIYEKYE